RTQHVVLGVVEYGERIGPVGVRPTQSPRNTVQYVFLTVGEHPVLPATVEQHVLVVTAGGSSDDPFDGLPRGGAFDDRADELLGREPCHRQWTQVRDVVAVTGQQTLGDLLQQYGVVAL